MPKVGGLYTGLNYDAARFSDASQVANADQKLLDTINDYNQENIAAVFEMPAKFLKTANNSDAVSDEKTIVRNSTIDGYTPRNNKLFTYPYNCLLVDSLDDTHIYRWEWAVGGSDITFDISCAMSCNPEIVASPVSYNGISGINVTESVIMKNFPPCVYVTDSYKQWLALNANANNLNKIGGGISALTGGISGALAGTAVAGLPGTAIGGVLGAIAGGANGILSMLRCENNENVASHMGLKLHGSQGNSTNVATGRKDFYFKRMCVTSYNAAIIDDYFDRFGYATYKLGTVNVRVRPAWTYVQTENVGIKGNIPNEDMVKIKSCFNKGITFWTSPTNVGNYNQTNTLSS